MTESSPIRPLAEAAVEPKRAAPYAFTDQHEEPENAALRRQLGLRPVAYGTHEEHPDRRPCPSWCWVGRSPDEDHEIEWQHPLTACHEWGPRVAIVASQYPGSASEGSAWTATIELTMEQLGQDGPTIKVYLRQGPDVTKLLMLSLDDADELSRGLAHVVAVAEGEAHG